MPRDQILKARQERNAALIEAMLLAAVADGKVGELELETLLRRVLERPEFDGTRPAELNALVEASAKKLAQAGDLAEILHSLQTRLETHANRMLAFGLAAAVAFADQRATRTELGLLKAFQRALGISEEEVVRIVEVIERGGSLAEALGEPMERLYAEVMVLVSAADGRLGEAEARELTRRFAEDPIFAGISRERAQGYVTEIAQALAAQGLPERLRALAAGLSTHTQRLKAFELGVRIADAAGQPSRAESRILDLLQLTFGIADDEVATLRKEAAR